MLKFFSYLFFVLTLVFSGCGNDSHKVGKQRNNGKPPTALPNTPVDEMIPGRFRLVWQRMVKGNGNDPHGRSRSFQLMGRESGGEERIILEAIDNYRKPLFTDDGKRIVFSDYKGDDFYVVNWDGSGKRKLRRGLAIEVWHDPDTQIDWVLFLPRRKQMVLDHGRPLHRCQIDKPEVVEEVWNSTEITADNFQLSRDGKKAGGLFPWNSAGLGDLETKRYEARGKGCWTSLAPDNSYLMWVFDGAHRNLYLKPDGSKLARKVYISNAPNIDGYETYHPRWSNHVRYMVMTGPYKNMGEHNAIGGGGKQINIYVGRFNAAFDAVEAWSQATMADEADFFPDLWVEGGEASRVDLPESVGATTNNAVAARTWPSNHQGLEFVWRNMKSPNEIIVPGRPPRYCKARVIGKARYGESFHLIAHQGALMATDHTNELAQAVAASGEFSCELAIYAPSFRKVPDWASILCFGRGEKDGNLILMQRHDNIAYNLEVKIGTANQPFAESATESLYQVHMPLDRPVYLTLTYRDGKLTFYQDGEPYAESQIFTGGLPWKSGPLLLGGLKDGSHDWPGFLEYAAFYSRALAPAEVAANAKFYIDELKTKTGAPSIKVRATLVETVPARDPSAIGEYRRDLVEYFYRVDQVINGECPHKEIVVQHWSVLDKKPMPLDKKAGQPYELWISPVESHPQLSGERVVTNDEQFDAPRFLDLSDP